VLLPVRHGGTLRIQHIEVNTIEPIKLWILGWLSNLIQQMYEGNFSCLILAVNLWAVVVGYKVLRRNRKPIINRHP